MRVLSWSKLIMEEQQYNNMAVFLAADAVCSGLKLLFKNMIQEYVQDYMLSRG